MGQKVQNFFAWDHICCKKSNLFCKSSVVNNGVLGPLFTKEKILSKLE